MSIIETKNLTKYYGKILGIKDVNLNIEEGEIFGFIGPNGAGKSTTIRLLLSLIYPTSGEALIFGKDIKKFGPELRRDIGYLPSEIFYYDKMKVKDLLNYSASFYEKDSSKKIKELASIMELDLDRRIEDLSYGNKKKVGIVQGLLHQPKLIILDEPTAGVDPKERIHIRNLISEMAENKIILLATHIVSDIECIADQVMLLKEGELVNMNTPQMLMEQMHGKVAEKPCDKTEIAALQKQYPSGNILQRKNGTVIRVVKDELDEGFEIVDNDINLEDVYLYYFGE